MEYVADEVEIRYLGLSVFETNDKGQYICNHVKSQDELLVMITRAAQLDGSVLHALASHHCSTLCQLLGQTYRGYIGIDMMVVDASSRPQLHPCVEINFRMTMGVVAMKLFERGVSALPFRSHPTAVFATQLADGHFSIIYRQN